jgi:hypothetical protein
MAASILEATMSLRSITLSILCAVLLAGPATAQAAPVTARFNGTVTGYEYGFLDPAGVAFDEDNPVGTSVSWTLNFNDDFLGLPYTDVFGPRVATGTLDVGSRRYALDGMSFFSLMTDVDGSTVLQYRPQVEGTGPTTSDGADFFALFFSFGRDLGLVGSPLVGFGYSSPFATIYGYLVTEGSYSVAPTGTVPAPGSLGLALAALGLVAGTAGARLRALPRV